MFEHDFGRKLCISKSFACFSVTSHTGSRCSNGPAEVSDNIYIGNKYNAHDGTLLRRLRITHVLNCAARPLHEGGAGLTSPYDARSNITYMAFEACDTLGYPIMRHYSAAKHFIDKALRQGGRVLVHCELGINRSGAICVAYMMERERLPLLTAIKRIKNDRPTVLVNEGFQQQLVDFARNQGLLKRRSHCY